VAQNVVYPGISFDYSSHDILFYPYTGEDMEETPTQGGGDKSLEQIFKRITVLLKR
jgi:hypothetical protein